jgi:transcriptional regulator with XRE-family HTH domain
MRGRPKETTTLAREIGDKLKNIRKKLELTQKQLSEKMPEKIDYTYIGKIERGEIMPSIKMLKRISEGLGIPVDFFFQKETVIELLNLLPRDIRGIAEEKDKLSFFRAVKKLDREDIPIVTEIIRILNKHRRPRAKRKKGELIYPLQTHTQPLGMVAEKKTSRKYKKKSKKSKK